MFRPTDLVGKRIFDDLDRQRFTGKHLNRPEIKVNRHTTGRKVWEMAYRGHGQQVNVANWASGLYLIVLQQGNETSIGRFIKE